MKKTTDVFFRPERLLRAAIGISRLSLNFRNTLGTTPRRYIILATDGVP